MPRKPHAPRKRDLTAMLDRVAEANGGTPSTQPVFFPQPEIPDEYFTRSDAGSSMPEQGGGWDRVDDDEQPTDFDLQQELVDHGLAAVFRPESPQSDMPPSPHSDDSEKYRARELPRPKWFPRRRASRRMSAGDQIKYMDSSDLYEENMQHYEWPEAIDVKEDIRKVNHGIPYWKGEYRIVDRLGEGENWHVSIDLLVVCPSPQRSSFHTLNRYLLISLQSNRCLSLSLRQPELA
jgi:hypothetical protein